MLDVYRNSQPHLARFVSEIVVSLNVPAIMPSETIFISYSSADSKWRDMLELHLKPFVKQGQVTVWSDAQTAAGQHWDREIRRAAAGARVAVLLVSAHFLASDYVVDEEVPCLIAAEKEESLKLLWIAVSSSSFGQTGLKDFQALNNPRKPLDSLSSADLERELVTIAEKIAAAAESGVDDKGEQRPEPRPLLTRYAPAPVSPIFYGMIGGSLAGIYIGSANYLTQQDPGWQFTFLLLVLFSAAIGCLSSALIHYFIRTFRERRKNARHGLGMLYDLQAGGMGGAITAVGASLLAAITFGRRLETPAISPEHLLMGVAIAAVLIGMSVLKTERADRLLSLAASFCAAVIIFSVLIAVFMTPRLHEASQGYFVHEESWAMLRKAALVGLAAGVVIGLQIAASRQIYRGFVALGQADHSSTT